jgi:hypothetical protein
VYIYVINQQLIMREYEDIPDVIILDTMPMKERDENTC